MTDLNEALQAGIVPADPWTGAVSLDDRVEDAYQAPGGEPAVAPKSIFEPLPSFLDRVGALSPPGMLVENLIPEDGITLFHGQPRDGKSFAALEILLALATGTPAFGLYRLDVPEAIPVVYLT